ncbi:MAG TPA: hypothetical protein VFP84_26225 [Kofleriaceae bacterium]|nr:hypothetical protein [Kofleriaceae bacterium]
MLSAPAKRPLGFELACVIVISLAVLVPGIWSYTLADPWETHYGDVSRVMLQDHDWVHTYWPQENEGFRSKPVLMFWMMSAAMRALGLAADGGYSGELVHDVRTLIAIRLPFVLSAVFGLAMMWWMLARLVNRRVAWLALLVVGSCPFVCMVARVAIPDVPLIACVIGAFALFTMAIEDGERPIRALGTIRGRAWDARHVVLGLAGGFVAVQAIYYAGYFASGAQLALRGVPPPAIWLTALIVWMLAGLHRRGWLIFRLPTLLVGGIIAAIVDEPMPRRAPGQSRWDHLCDDILVPWDRHALDRYLIAGLAFPVVWLAVRGRAWAASRDVAARALAMAPITTMRQLYLIACYSLLGISVLAKGPPGVAVVGLVGVLHVVLMNGWRALASGAFEIKRGLLVMIVTFLPWHIAMYLREGVGFINEYLFFHILNRASIGVDNSPGTFEYYTSQLGHGMWLWAGLLPAAVTAGLVRSRLDTREGRVRFLVAIWAIAGVAFFSLVQTKFHHYILPAVPALGILIAFFLDDVLAGRDRLHPLFAALGAAIVLLICRDLMHEPARWIELFVFRYDRPWPSADPWAIDPSDGFLALGVCAALALALAATRLRRLGVIAVCTVGFAICVWSLQVYMPLAGPHWGMGDEIRTYYKQRTIYGQKLLYFGARELADDWAGVGDAWSFETEIPDNLQVGQPMSLKIQVNKASDERVMEQELTLVGNVRRVGDHTVELQLAPGERAKLDPLIARGKAERRGRPAVRAVDADRLIAWILYWRGENFWSGDEIWGWPPEMKTAFTKTDNVDFLKYLNDRTRAPLGRRYFLITEAGRATSVRTMLPTQRAKETFEVLDTTSNKFTLVAFYL